MSAHDDEAAQHARAMAAWLLVRDDITNGRRPIPRLITTSLACACPQCLGTDWAVEQARGLGAWLYSTAVERFVSQCCEISPSAKAKPAELLAAYRGWAHGANEDTTVSGVALGRALSDRVGVRSVTANGKRFYRGIGLQR